jgi:hypothetical protein
MIWLITHRVGICTVSSLCIKRDVDAGRAIGGICELCLSGLLQLGLLKFLAFGNYQLGATGDIGRWQNTLGSDYVFRYHSRSANLAKFQAQAAIGAKPASTF